MRLNQLILFSSLSICLAHEPICAQTELSQKNHSNISELIRSKVEGTFYFYFAKGGMKLMLQSEIEELYDQIDGLRQEESVVVWNLSDNTNVIILPFSEINDPSFVKLNNPYTLPQKLLID